VRVQKRAEIFKAQRLLWPRASVPTSLTSQKDSWKSKALQVWVVPKAACQYQVPKIWIKQSSASRKRVQLSCQSLERAVLSQVFLPHRVSTKLRARNLLKEAQKRASARRRSLLTTLPARSKIFWIS
jgi:hypothetical protein